MGVMDAKDASTNIRKCLWCWKPNFGSWQPLQHKHRALCIECTGWLERAKATGEAIATPRPSGPYRAS